MQNTRIVLLFLTCFSINACVCLLLPSASTCKLNSTENVCLLQKINEMDLQMKILMNRLSSLETKEAKVCPQIYFMVKSDVNGYPHVHNGNQLKLSVVMLNKGSGYKQYHGNFIAPVTGTYFFTYTATTTPHSWIKIYLKRNGTIVGQLLNTALNNYLKTTESVLVHLNTDDDVWLEVGQISADTTISGKYETHFSGFLLDCS